MTDPTQPETGGIEAIAAGGPVAPAPVPGRTAAGATDPGRRTGIGRASALLASGTLVSRALGFASAAVLAWVIGQQNAGANAFALANQLPNNIVAIIAGGLLSAVFVPQIVRAAHHRDGGQAFVNRLVTLGATIFLAVTVVATVAAPLLVQLYTLGNGEDALAGGGFALAIGFAYWCLPQVLFYALHSLIGDVLNARGVFGPVTWAPVLNNIVVLGTLVLFAVLFGVDPAHRDPAGWDAAKVALLAGGATLGVALQSLLLLVFWRRTGLGFRPDFRWRGVGLGATGRAATWTLGMILISTAAGIVQSVVALTADAEDASVAVLRTSWLIFALPHSIVAMSIATAYFTRISGHARDGDVASLRADLSAALRQIVLLIAGATAALAVAALPFAAFFANNDREVTGIAGVLLAYLAGLIPFSAIYMVQRVFFALGDTRTPFLIQLIQGVLFFGGALSMLLVPSPWVAAGIAGVTSVAGTVQALIAAAVARRRIGGIDGRRVLSRFVAYFLAMLPAAAVGLVVLWALGGLDLGAGSGLGDNGFALSGTFAALLSVAVVGAVTGVTYLGVLWLARIPELRELAAPVLRLLRHGRPGPGTPGA